MKHQPIKTPAWLLVAAVSAFLWCIWSDADADWSTNDTRRQVLVTVLYAGDALTTMNIKNHTDVEELGVVARQILGENPETLETALYFTGLAAANYAIAKRLPEGGWRTGWQTGSALISGTFIINNWRLGLRPAWK